MMFCANCYKEIPAGKSYYKHQDTNQSYCSLECFNDHMIYTHTITLETSEGAETTEEQDNDECEDFIEDLRRNGVKLIKNDGSLVEIPSDFLKRATELCNELRCSSITYDIVDPQDSEHTKLRVLDCGYAE